MFFNRSYFPYNRVEFSENLQIFEPGKNQDNFIANLIDNSQVDVTTFKFYTENEKKCHLH